MKCGNCQRNRIKNKRDRHDHRRPMPVADQPMKTGSAPATAPIAVFMAERVLSGV